MEQLTKNQIGNIVRKQIHIQTGKSIKSMHIDTRIYDKKAEGVYPRNYSGKNLGLNADSMDRILLEIEEELKIDLELEGSWGDPRSFVGTPVEYNKNTRLHSLIDFVHDTYNKAVKHEQRVQDKKLGKPKEPEPVEEKDAESVVEKLYLIKVRKNNRDVFVCTNSDNFYEWTSSFMESSFFVEKEIQDVFDLEEDDVIGTSKTNNLSGLLRSVGEPFDLYFIEFNVIKTDHWTYDEKSQIDEILGKLSPEEAQIIRSKLA